MLLMQENNKAPYMAAILFLLAGIVRVPFPTNYVPLSTQVAFEMSVSLLVAVWLWKQDKWIALFLCLSMFSLVRTNYSIQSFYAYYAVFYGIVWYSLIVALFTRENIRLLMNVICIIALVNVAFIALQEMGLDPVFTSHADPTGLCGNPNFANILLAFSVPAFLRPKWTAGLIAVVAGLIATTTSTGTISAAVGVIFYLSFYGLFWFGFMGATVFVGMYLIFVDGFGLERFPVWQIAIDKYSEHWITGWGLGRWKAVFNRPIVTGTVWLTPHNEYIQGLFELGVGFPVLVLGYFANILKKSIRVRFKLAEKLNVSKFLVPDGFWRIFRSKFSFALIKKDALIPLTALVIIAVSCIGQFPFHVAPTAGIAVTWLAILTVSLKENENARR